MASRGTASPSTFDVQTIQPRLRTHGPVLLVILFGTFPLFFFLERGPNRIFHCALSILAVSAVLYHSTKEYRLVHDRLTTIGVVTYYGMGYKGNSRVLQFIMRKFSPDVPIIDYSFVAFDQKTYTGKTGFGVRGLYKGAKITVLYKPGKPSVNHPVTSFIFYSFQSSDPTVRATP
jgi:hypothetical protein